MAPLSCAVAAACVAAVQPPATLPVAPNSPSEATPTKSPAETPDLSIENARWARLARFRHTRYLDEGCERFRIGRESEEIAPQGDGQERKETPLLRADAWPFEGKAPAPPLFDSGEAPPPDACLEWRRVGGALMQSYAQGDAGQQRDCARAMDLLQQALGTQSTPPDWSRAALIPLVCHDDPALRYPPRGDGYELEHPGEERDAWCSAWADWYAIDGARLRLVIATDPVRSQSRAFVFGTGEDGGGMVASDALPAIAGPSYSCSSPMLMRADFDANGTPDFFMGNRITSMGLGITSFMGAFILADRTSRTARITPFDESEVEFIDHDRNGRMEILTRTLRGEPNCLDGRLHNFWITNLLGFQDLAVVDLRNIDRIRHGEFVGRFPVVEWFSHDPAHRFRTLLSDAQRESISAPEYPLYRRRALSNAGDGR